MKVNVRELWTRTCILLFFILLVIIQLLNHTVVSLLLTGYTHVTLGVTFDLLETDGGSEPSLEDPTTLWFKGSGARAAGGSCRPIGSSGPLLTADEDDAASGLYKT